MYNYPGILAQVSRGKWIAYVCFLPRSKQAQEIITSLKTVQVNSKPPLSLPFPTFPSFHLSKNNDERNYDEGSYLLDKK